MERQNKTSLNHQVYQKTYKRLHLTSSQRVIFQRLLGFLIRNDKPFPYSVVKMAELTGFDKRTIFRVLNRLEFLRLIRRIGEGNNRRFCRGSVLCKIISTVTNRNKIIQSNILTTATLCHQKSNNRDTVSYKKTSLSLKHKEEVIISQRIKDEYQEYCGRIKSDEILGLIPKGTKPRMLEEWMAEKGFKMD